MAADEQGPPKQPTTVQLPAVPDWAIELTKSVKSGFQTVNQRLDTIETNQDLQGATVRDLQQRMTLMETRQANNSERVRGASEVDLKHDAAIASLIQKVDAIAEKPDTAALVLAEMKKAATTPTGQKVLGSLATLVMLVLAAATLKLQATVQRLEEKPVPPQIHDAAPVDAGVH